VEMVGERKEVRIKRHISRVQQNSFKYK